MLTDREIAEAMDEDNKLHTAKGWKRVVKPRDPTVIETQGGAAWAKFFYPHLFTREFTGYQYEFWDWGWSIEKGEHYRPRIECEPRGVGKSTNAEAWVVSLLARRRREMIGYVSLNDEKATKHFEGIKTMLESEALLKYYPHCKPKMQKLRSITQQWSREAIVTDSDAMIVPLTLLGSSRGWKSATGTRFDVIVLDDIDALGQSVDVQKKLIELLKAEILAAGDNQTVVLMPQNLIYRDSVCSQIYDQRADILSDRIFCGPYPLMKSYDAVKEDLPGDTSGAMLWRITSGEAFDPAITIDYAEKLLNTFGKATFDRECQQKVFEVEDDKDFREWDERFHIITASEFRSVMEGYREPVWNSERQCLQIPSRWHVGIGLDWGTTTGHPSAAAYVARPSEVCPLKDCHFVFGEVIRPVFPRDSFADVEVVSPGRVAAALNAFQRHWNISDSQIQMKLMSHEASAALNTMAIDLKADEQQFFNKWKAEKGSGVPQIQNLLEIDRSKSHPFRCDPVSGEALQGSPRIFFIVADGQGELKVDQNGTLYVIGARDDKGMARARFEMPLYSYRNQGNKKIDDDWVDGFRGLMARFGVTISGYTYEEKVERALPVPLRVESLNQMPDSDIRDSTLTKRMIEVTRIQKEMAMPVRGAYASRFRRR